MEQHNRYSENSWLGAKRQLQGRSARHGFLQECDPEAEVRIMMQENWPFECAVRGVVTREQLGNPDCDCDRRAGRPHDE
jgi:hypothetical protein